MNAYHNTFTVVGGHDVIIFMLTSHRFRFTLRYDAAISFFRHAAFAADFRLIRLAG